MGAGIGDGVLEVGSAAGVLGEVLPPEPGEVSDGAGGLPPGGATRAGELPPGELPPEDVAGLPEVRRGEGVRRPVSGGVGSTHRPPGAPVVEPGRISTQVPVSACDGRTVSTASPPVPTNAVPMEKAARPTRTAVWSLGVLRWVRALTRCLQGFLSAARRVFRLARPGPR